MGKNNIKTLQQYIKIYGFRYVMLYIYRKMTDEPDIDYMTWISEKEKKQEELEPLVYCPLISVVVPIYNVEEDQLIECIESVVGQTYQNWQLCLVDDCSTDVHVKEVLKRYENHPQIVIQYRKENGHISRCTNTGISVAEGEYIGFLDCDDYLSENALYEVVKCLNQDASLDFIYSDEDLVTVDGKTRIAPILKPDWSPDKYLSHNYTNHFSVYRAAIVKKIKGLRPEYDGSQDYDFVLRFTEHTKAVAHIPQILYHWRVRPESVASGNNVKPYVFDASKRALEDTIKRRKWKAKIEYVDTVRQWNVIYDITKHWKVSLCISSSNASTLLQKCLKSIKEHTTYKNYEILVCSNQNSDKEEKIYQQLATEYNFCYIVLEGEFSLARSWNNLAKYATGDVFVYLHDDVEVMEEKWLERMLGQLEQQDIGAVGGKMLYPGGKIIQSIGMAVGASGPITLCRQIGAFCNLQDGVVNNFTGVSDGCFMVTKEKFLQVEGFRTDCVTRYTELDFFYRLIGKGYRNVYRPDVIMLHQELGRRETEKNADEKNIRKHKDIEEFCKKNEIVKKSDSYYSSGFSQVFGKFMIDKVTSTTTSDITAFQKRVEVEWNYEINIMQDNQGRIAVYGFAWAKKCRRSLTDTLWIQLTGEDGHAVYIKTRKEYRGYISKQEKKENGTVWSGFLGSGKPELRKQKYHISLIVVKRVQKKVYCGRITEYVNG